MNSKLNKSAVLTGYVDSFCLVCEYHLRGEGAAEEHVARAIHQKNLDVCPYLDKFAEDCIRKVKKGYFCEFCNLLLPTATKVGLHITENSHNDNKGAHMIQRVGNHIVISKNVLITELAWNGITKDACAICNAEFHNLKLHLTDHKHVLSLIQKKVEFCVGNVVFRKIDDLSFHCLICNVIYALSILGVHYNDNVHKTNVQKCQESYREHIENNKENEKDVNNKIKANKNNVNVLSNNTVTEENKPTGKMPNKSELKPVLNTDNKQNIQKTKNVKTTHPSQENKNDVNNGVKDNKKDKNVGTNINRQDKGTPTNFTQTDCLQSQTKENMIAHSVKDPKTHDQSTNTNKTANNSKSSRNNNTDKLFEFVTDFQKNGVNINFETETAFCKKCFEDVKLELESIQKHIAEHKNKPTKERPNAVHTVDLNNSKTVLNSKDIESNQTDKATIQKKYNLDQNDNETLVSNDEEQEEIIKIDLTKKSVEHCEDTDSNPALTPFIAGAAKPEADVPKETAKVNEKLDMNDPAVFAKTNKLTFNKNNKNAFCRICNIRVPASIKNMKEHVSGTSHTKKAAKLAKSEQFIPKKPMAQFIFQKSTIINLFGIDDVILNDSICLTRMSYYMITVQNRLRCQACEVNLTDDQILRHVDSVFHERAMNNTPVVWRLDTEFVREVRPGLFHCGYCNLIVGIYDDVAKHLKCSDHMSNKCDARSRLGEHLPPILARRAQTAGFFFQLLNHYI